MTNTAKRLNTAPSARVIGQSLESLLDATAHEAYKRAGLARIWHEGTRAIPTRSGWKAISSRPDYAGLLIGSGQAIAFDAKHCQENRYRHSKDRLHQLRDLYEVHEAGGLAGILVVNLNADAAWWLPPHPLWERGEFVSTVLGDLPHAIPVGRHPDFYEFVPDWLTTAIMANAKVVKV